MPRKSVVPSRKRPQPASGTERRSKARNDPVRPQPPVRSPPRPVSSRPCAGKAVSTGRYVNFDYLSRKGFTIGDRLRAQGLEFFCSLDLPTYPGLVREFYGTVSRGNGGIQGTVAGVPLFISEDFIAQILHLPQVGVSPTHPANRTEALTAILGSPPQSPIEKVFANQLSIEMRLLLSIISRTLFPNRVGLTLFQKET